MRTRARLGNAQQTQKATPETSIPDVQQQSSKIERQPVSMPEKPKVVLIVQPAVPSRVIEPGQPPPGIISKENVSTPDRPVSVPEQPGTLALDGVTRMADEEKNNGNFATPWSPDAVPPKMRAWYGLLARSDLTGGNIPHCDFTVADDKEAIATFQKAWPTLTA